MATIYLKARYGRGSKRLGDTTPSLYCLPVAPERLRQHFLANLDEEVRPSYESWPALGAKLEEALASAREEWPGINANEEDFPRYLAARAFLDEDSPELPAFASDLYLAMGCISGDQSALAHFEQRIVVKIDGALARLGLSHDDADDIRQETRERLLVGSDKSSPALEGYLGTGALSHWVRAVASRRALASLRGKKRMLNIEDQVIEDSSDPQLAGLKEQHRDEFKHALHAAVAELGARERTILSALVIDDRSVADIARVYKVHRVTASRWIAGIRKSLFIRTRAHLRNTLNLSEGELQSMIRMVESQMQMSLTRVLEDEE